MIPIRYSKPGLSPPMLLVTVPPYWAAIVGVNLGARSAQVVCWRVHTIKDWSGPVGHGPFTTHVNS